MNNLKQQTKYIREVLPKIAMNLHIARLIDEVKPGLTTSQLMILLILKDMKDIALPVGKLSQELGVSFPSVSGIIDRLHGEKLIERSRSRQDRRLVLVKLSNTGKEIIERLLKAFEKLLFDVLKKMPEAERETITKAVERVFEFSIALSKDAQGEEVSLPETAN
jgi:DNA-binding MarR family transcriptional regulator